MAEHAYNVIIGKHTNVTDAIRDYVTKKLQKLERLSDNIIDIHVTFENQKTLHTVSIVMHFGHYTVKGHGEGDDIYAAIDKATDRVKHLLYKYKDKLQNHHVMGHADVNMIVDVYNNQPTETDLINDAIEEESARRDEEHFRFHKIVRQEKKPLKTLSASEALIKMELSSEPFMIYRGKEDLQLKVIYRMPDDNYGIAQPE